MDSVRLFCFRLHALPPQLQLCSTTTMLKDFETGDHENIQKNSKVGTIKYPSSHKETKYVYHVIWNL